MAKKSKAQLRRLEKRAAERGEEYVRPPSPQPPTPPTVPAISESNAAAASTATITITVNDNKVEKTNNIQGICDIVKRLQSELKEIEDNQDLKSKDRRSLKRKVEAIASTDAGFANATELMEWYEQNVKVIDSTSNKEENKTEKDNCEDHEISFSPKFLAVTKLIKELEAIESNKGLKSKDRRSAKRKAEAIATEACGMPATELLEWYERNEKMKKNKQKTSGSKPDSVSRRKDPLIAFFGQLSFETTKDELMEHIRSQLGDTYKVTDKTVTIRMLTHEKTKEFRGMAFVEVDDPEFLYALLKLHQTFLKGRRINVERSAGGKKNSETRKSKLQLFKKEQEEYFAKVVDNILSEYKTTGELREDELDEGVVAMCRRHSGPVVRAAVAEYIEKGGRDMDNPSAYLTFLVSKFAKEGIHDEEATGMNKKNKPNPWKKRKTDDSTTIASNNKRWKESSGLARSGVNMSVSDKIDTLPPTSKDHSKRFPSSQRGIGRGYMRNVR
jgi:RNA recognition motif-containing protein